MPVSAPITITERKKRCAPSCWSAYATGASAAFPDVIVVYFIIPRSTTATPTYSNVQMISEAMIPNGRSRCGLLHSSAAVETDFFFQAEDGIRDLTVTGVQTCALPI